MSEFVPTIHLVKMPAGYYNLFLNGKKKNFIYGSSKKFMERFLKRTYRIDLRTDPRVIKNFKEFTIKKVGEKNGKILYIKTRL